MINPNKNLCQRSCSSRQPICPEPYKKMVLSNRMRLVWEQHVYWTRILLISIAERLKDQNDVTKRLLQNPKDIADVFATYYPASVVKSITNLLTQHLIIGGELITALRDQKTQEAEKLNQQWYANADQMAKAFSDINPHYAMGDLREMLYTHLKLTTQEVSMRLAGNYVADIESFNKVEKEALSMADYFTSGIIKQFPRKFNK